MDRLDGSIMGPFRAVRRGERFVRLVVGGGLAVVVGLWMVELTGAWSVLWGLGIVLMVGGVALLAGGIGSQLGW